jgi:hypothetical protein
VVAEFLKDEPYNTGQQDIGLRPWLLRIVGFQDTAKQLETKTDPEQEMIGLKKERIGQSIITAEISVWSGTDAKGGYAATVIFFLTVLAICVYVFLRETGIDRFTAGSGALLAVLLAAVTRLSLNGFLSQVATLFVFPFFASLLRSRDLSARSFTSFFSVTLAHPVVAYSEIAPIGFGKLFLGVMLVRPDKFRAKKLMLMSAILLIALMNPCYLRNSRSSKMSTLWSLGIGSWISRHLLSLVSLSSVILLEKNGARAIFAMGSDHRSPCVSSRSVRSQRT